jgi:hypothetical protein
VKWKNYDSTENTWETLDSLRNSMELVVEYEQGHAVEPTADDDIIIAQEENKCRVCDYVGVTHADMCVHMASVHHVKVPVKSRVADVYELDSAMIHQLQKQEQEFTIIYDTNLGDIEPAVMTTKQ